MRVRFRKQGDLRFAGHRDILRTFERLLRRAEVPLSMSEGFHPKPRMNFPLPLAVGIEAREEVVELELAAELSGEELLGMLAPQCPPGMEIIAAEAVALGKKNKAVVSRVQYEIQVPPERRKQLSVRLAEVLSAASLEIERTRKNKHSQQKKMIDVRPLLFSAELEQKTLRFVLNTPRENSVGPRDVLAAFGIADLETQGHCLVRTRVELQS